MRLNLTVLFLLPVFVACSAGTTAPSNGINIPNLITGGSSTEIDYQFVDVVDLKVAGTSTREKILLAASRGHSSIRIAKTNEILALMNIPVTRFFTADVNGDGVKDIFAMNFEASTSEAGLRIYDGKILYDERRLVSPSRDFNGPVCSVAEFGNHFLLALGSELAEVDSNLQEVNARRPIAGFDLYKVAIKGGQTQYAILSSRLCANDSPLPFCLELWSGDLAHVDDNYSTNAQPGRFTSLTPMDSDGNGSFDRLFVANRNKTRELKYNAQLKLTPENLLQHGNGDIFSNAVFGGNFFGRSNAFADLLVVTEGENSSTATLYQQGQSGSNPGSTLSPYANWTLPHLKSVLSRDIFDGGDLLLMESDKIHVLQARKTRNGQGVVTSIAFDTAFVIQD